MTNRLMIVAALLGVAMMSVGAAMAQCGAPACCEPSCVTCAPSCALSCDVKEKSKTIFSSKCETVCGIRLCLTQGCDVGCDVGCGCDVCEPEVCGEATCGSTCGPTMRSIFGITCGKPHVSKKLLLKKVPCGSELVYSCTPCDTGCATGCGEGAAPADMPVEEAAPAPAPATTTGIVPVPVPRPAAKGAMLIAPLPPR